MKKIVLEIVKLVVLSIALNIILNVIIYLFNIEISEIASYGICIIRNLCIVFMGVKILWKDMDMETLKKILIAFTVVLVAYNIFSVVKDIAEYEEQIHSEIPRGNIQYDDTLTERERKELQKFVGTLRSAAENLQEYLKQEREEYYALLLRAYVVIYNLITIIIYCFVAPKWFELQNQKNQNNRTFDFYKE